MSNHDTSLSVLSEPFSPNVPVASSGVGDHTAPNVPVASSGVGDHTAPNVPLCVKATMSNDLGENIATPDGRNFRRGNLV